MKRPAAGRSGPSRARPSFHTRALGRLLPSRPQQEVRGGGVADASRGSSVSCGSGRQQGGQEEEEKQQAKQRQHASRAQLLRHVTAVMRHSGQGQSCGRLGGLVVPPRPLPSPRTQDEATGGAQPLVTSGASHGISELSRP